jgi:hypothetical protein
LSNIYDLSGKKKVIFTKEPDVQLTYKEIMTMIIQYSTEEGCHQIFCEGGVTLCPSEVLGDIINKEKEEEDCNYKSIGCTKCWSNAIKLLKRASAG